MESNKLVITGWVLVEQAQDIPGTWVAHFLDFDVISHGESPKDALDCVAEAVAMAVTDDLNDARDPSMRPRAPEQYWDRLVRVLKHGEEVKISEVKHPSILACQITLAFERISRDHQTEVDLMLNRLAPTGYIDQIAA